MKLLPVRVFDERTKKVAYTKQTQAVMGKNKSNFSLYAVGDNANQSRIYKPDEMDAGHIFFMEQGGDRSAKNCQIGCTTRQSGQR